ncbi:MAG: Glyoxalase-like domain protein [Syntrophorhabdus sp. PtaB.Bin047]|nr:MAG: Glyoxalase-like domain protein [Syntrophorhabdus sp. PtaB.Bin047]
MKLDHIGFVVEKIDEFVETLRTIGFPSATKPVPDYDKNVNASFVPVGEKDEIYLEVLEPLDDRSAVHNFLKRTGGGLHHLCFEVDDIAKASKELEEKGFRMVSPPTTCGAYDENLGRSCAGATRISFFLLPNRLLVELVEKGR